MKCEDIELEVLVSPENIDADCIESHHPSITQHVASCAVCQDRLEQLAANTNQWEETRMQLSNLNDRQAEHANGHLRWTRRSAWSNAMAESLLSPPKHPEMLGRVGRYDIERLIGSGGMGVVFKAYDTELNRPVALKLLAPYLSASGSARQRFAREARAAAAVIDDHVVPIHNVETDEQHPFLVMRYVAGGSLQQRLDREGPLEVCEVLRIGMQTAKGLSAAHAQGLIHRDVKPSNVLLDEGVDRALLTDFGLARATDDANLTRSGFHPGTPHYMSPEQVRGETIDERSDLFGLGCVLYGLCTGHPPFRSETSYAVLRRITDDDPRPIREVNPDVPEWLERIVLKLLEKSADDRFDSAQQVAELLEDCLAHLQQPTTTPLPESLNTPSTLISYGGNGRTPWRKLVAAAAFAFSLMIAGTLIVLELNKGTLKIESEVDDVPIRIMQGKELVEELTVSQQKQSVRIAAGHYRVEFDGQFDGANIKEDVVELNRGTTAVVKIVRKRNPAVAKTKESSSTADLKAHVGETQAQPPRPAQNKWHALTGALVREAPAFTAPARTKYRGAVIVTEVKKGSPADTAGIRVSDYLIGVGSWQTTSLRDVEGIADTIVSGKVDSNKVKFYIVRYSGSPQKSQTLFGYLDLSGSPKRHSVAKSKKLRPTTLPADALNSCDEPPTVGYAARESTKVYDVGSYVSDVLFRGVMPRGMSPADSSRANEAVKAAVDELIGVVESTCGPCNSIQFNPIGMELLVRHTREGHDKIRELLQVMRIREPGWIELKVIGASSEFIPDKHEAEFRKWLEGSSKLTVDEVRKYETWLGEGPDNSVLKTTLCPGKPMTVSVMDFPLTLVARHVQGNKVQIRLDMNSKEPLMTSVGTTELDGSGLVLRAFDSDNFFWLLVPSLSKPEPVVPSTNIAGTGIVGADNTPFVGSWRAMEFHDADADDLEENVVLTFSEWTMTWITEPDEHVKSVYRVLSDNKLVVVSFADTSVGQESIESLFRYKFQTPNLLELQQYDDAGNLGTQTIRLERIADGSSVSTYVSRLISVDTGETYGWNEKDYADTHRRLIESESFLGSVNWPDEIDLLPADKDAAVDWLRRGNLDIALTDDNKIEIGMHGHVRTKIQRESIVSTIVDAYQKRIANAKKSGTVELINLLRDGHAGVVKQRERLEATYERLLKTEPTNSGKLMEVKASLKHANEMITILSERLAEYGVPSIAGSYEMSLERAETKAKQNRDRESGFDKAASIAPSSVDFASSDVDFATISHLRDRLQEADRVINQIEESVERWNDRVALWQNHPSGKVDGKDIPNSDSIDDATQSLRKQKEQLQRYKRDRDFLHREAMSQYAILIERYDVSRKAVELVEAQAEAYQELQKLGNVTAFAAEQKRQAAARAKLESTKSAKLVEQLKSILEEFGIEKDGSSESISQPTVAAPPMNFDTLDDFLKPGKDWFEKEMQKIDQRLENAEKGSAEHRLLEAKKAQLQEQWDLGVAQTKAMVAAAEAGNPVQIPPIVIPNNPTPWKAPLPDPLENHDEQIAKVLAGTWDIRTLSDSDDQKFDELSATFSKNMFIVHFKVGDEHGDMQYMYRIFGDKIDVWNYDSDESQTDRVRPMLGSFTLNGDTLRICHHEHEMEVGQPQPRPPVRPGEGLVYWEMKRRNSAKSE